MTSVPPAGNDPATADGRRQDQGESASAPGDRSDEELMALLQRRDLGAFETLYDRHYRVTLALAYRVVGDFEAAEDVVQETFLAAWRQSETYHHARGRVRSWLLSIARHRAIDRLRRARPQRQLAELDTSVVDPEATDALEAAGESARREHVLQALKTLSEEQRQTVELAYYGGLTHQEISERTNLPLGTVKGRMRLAMDKLRLALANLAPDEGGPA
jgi:RNA polymerase sigma-70 factor, ECF subfamily